MGFALILIATYWAPLWCSFCGPKPNQFLPIFVTNQTIYIHSRTQTRTKVGGGGQATLTIPGTNIQIPLGPTQPAQQQQNQQQSTQNQSTNQTQQNLNQSGGQVTTSQQNQQTSQQNVQQTQSNTGSQQQQPQQQQQQQQQNTVITIPGTNNTIQIPSNFAGKIMSYSSYNSLSFSLCGAWILLTNFLL